MDDFELIIDHGSPADRKRARKYMEDVRRERTLYQKVWGVIICLTAIAIQAMMGIAEFMLVTIYMLFIGITLFLYRGDILHEYREIRRRENR